jgi:hypothetical protein
VFPCFLPCNLHFQIPDKKLEDQPRSQPAQPTTQVDTNISNEEVVDEEEEEEEGDDERPLPSTPRVVPRRRLSTYEPTDGVMDMESNRVGGSARQGRPPLSPNARV